MFYNIRLTATFLLFVLFLDWSHSYADVIDWSHFEIADEVMEIDSVAFIRDLPVHQYWDVHKGSFRTGVIGDIISKTHPSLVSSLERKTMKAGKSAMIETIVVDQLVLYMHTLLAIQKISDRHNMVSSLVNPRGERGNDARTILFDSENVSLSELALAHQTMQTHKLRLNLISQSMELERDRRHLLNSERNSTMMNSLDELHTQILAASDSSFHDRRQNNYAKYENLQRLILKHEESKRLYLREFLESQYILGEVALQHSINTTMQALAFRSMGELEVALKQQENQEIEIFTIKADLLRTEVEEVVGTVFEEIYGCVRMITTDPTAVWLALQYALLVACLFLFTLETVRLLLTVVKMICGASHLPRVTPLTNSGVVHSPNAFCWAPGSSNQLRIAIDSFDIAITNGLPLPNMLVSGPAGSGKSTACGVLLDRVAQLSGNSAQYHACNCLRVCGADLQALGSGPATHYFNELFQSYSYSSWKRPLILLIDDADCLVGSRIANNIHGDQDKYNEYNSEIDTRTTAFGCIFSLLTGIRDNHTGVSVILVCRLNIDSVDSALLDRLDVTLRLELPEEKQRLHYALNALDVLRHKVLVGTSAADSSKDMPINWTPLSAIGAVEEAMETRLSRLCELLDTFPLPSHMSSGFTLCEAGSITCRGGAIDNPAICPEMETPMAHNSLSSMLLLHDRHANCDSEKQELLCSLFCGLKASKFSDESFDILLCLKLMLKLSARWSYRDIKQFFSALNHAVMCSDRCQLSSAVWIRELVYSFD